MTDIRELGALQLDGLREVASIGAGHAATALSQLTDRRIMVEVPELQVVPLESVAELTRTPDEVVAAAAMHVLGDVTGRTVQIFPGETACRLVEILMPGSELEFPDGFGELEQSALKEVGNILVGAYLNALSDFLGVLLLPSVPGLALDLTGAVLTSAGVNPKQESDYVLCIATVFTIDEEQAQLPGHFLLLPDPGSLEVILRAIRLT